MKPNILLYFSDQQRSDTIGAYGQPLDITPNLDKLAYDGVLFEQAYTAQPVCGPCRAIFQSGQWPTTTGCFRNNIMLPTNIKTLANYMEEAGYENAYVGKWHLASSGDLAGNHTINNETTAIPKKYRGGYNGFWRVADTLEKTSHGYDGYVFDENNNKIEFKGYRVDKIVDFGLEFLDKYNKEKPFFLTISMIEPHHQNDHNHHEGPKGSKERWKNFELPHDLKVLGGNSKKEYPDYLGACKSIDDNLGRILEKLKEIGELENTVIIFISDHGSHFYTRNQNNPYGIDDYKRSAHASASKVPLIFYGPGFKGGKRIRQIVSTSSLTKTIISIAGNNADELIGEDLTIFGKEDEENIKRDNLAFIQISESKVGRAIRTPEFLYAVKSPDTNFQDNMDSDIYVDDFLYDLKLDPFELNNIVFNPKYEKDKLNLRKLLIKEIEKAENKTPKIY
ncbi:MULTISPECIES: sulfatase-like hydrolase/transferase [Helcococcus]|uniref:Sulfatase-like hydrolase/transferase n=1 Tax=Helcococcus bovis TaxID=3153252 RepID=A0ABW9F7F5_9FIRM